MRFILAALPISVFVCSHLNAQVYNANRLSYLDEPVSAYHPDADFPQLTTPQWFGEPGVDAVVILSIDDMREPAAYENFLRPILRRLKEIDGRAPVSIMSCSVSAESPQVQSWLAEGLSIEVHTIDHPCPLLQRSDFRQAKNTYDACVDLMASIPQNHPVAFRMPCCDSINSPSPRFWSEIFQRWTPRGNYLEIDSSVFNLITQSDRQLPTSITRDENGRDRFRRYLPFPSFVNTIENYPYPYVIGNSIWQFPCAVPSDWEAQNIRGSNQAETVEDWKRVLDATVIKQGVMTLVFHPHGWIQSDQLVQLIDYAESRYGRRVRFLNFSDALQRLNQNLLQGQPLRSTMGLDNGVRIVDIDNDGSMDVLIGNDQLRRTRLWSKPIQQWRELPFPTQFVSADARQSPRTTGAVLGLSPASSQPFVLVAGSSFRGAWVWKENDWVRSDPLIDSLAFNQSDVRTAIDGIDQGVRFRDLNHDGIPEAILGGIDAAPVLTFDPKTQRWRPTGFSMPEQVRLVDSRGRDAGLRWIDLDQDGDDDIVFSDDDGYSVHRFVSMQVGWRTVRHQRRDTAAGIPMIVRGATNNGGWVHSGHLWFQNEDTAALSDGVDRRSFSQLLDTNADRDIPPKAPLRFEAVTIDSHVGEICYAVNAADVNGDGRLDIVAVSEDSVFWYSNPNWERHVIISHQTEPHNVCIAPADIDGDGKVDFALGAGWTQVGTLQWLKRGPTLDEPWTVHPIAQELWLHRIRMADVLGKGKPQVVASPLNKSMGEGVRLLAFEIPEHPETDPWQSTVMDHSFNRLHNHWHIDLDGDGQMETLTASQEGISLIRRTDGSWHAERWLPGASGATPETRGAGEIKTGRLADGRLYLATIEPMHGTDAVVYIAQPDSTFQRIVLDQSLGRGHAVWTANLDSDEDEELIVGHSDPGSGAIRGPGVFVFDPREDGAAWEKITLDDGGIATEDLIAADFTGDGQIDIVAGGRATHNVKLYVNRSREAAAADPADR